MTLFKQLKFILNFKIRKTLFSYLSKGDELSFLPFSIFAQIEKNHFRANKELFSKFSNLDTKMSQLEREIHKLKQEKSSLQAQISNVQLEAKTKIQGLEKKITAKSKVQESKLLNS
jgi:hypothetical protein